MKTLREELLQLEVKIQAEMVHFLLLLQKGEREEARKISETIKHKLIEVGPRMQTLALEIGATFPKRVSSFLSGVERLVRAVGENRDASAPAENKAVEECREAAEKLERLLVR